MLRYAEKGTDGSGIYPLPIASATLCKRLKHSRRWAVFYLWLCEVERTSPDGRITLRINDVAKVFPWMNKCRFYNMMRIELLTYGYFERVEKVKWQTTYRSRIKITLPELVRIAKATIDRGEKSV